MSRHLNDCAADVLESLRAAANLFCFLDYDGTLAPIAPTPAQAHPLAGTDALLERLSRAPRTWVAVVSGRSIDDVRRFVDVAGVYYIGIHGLELLCPGGERQISPGAAVIRALMPGLRRQLEEQTGSWPGILLEDKGPALACHYRLATREDAQRARAAVIAVVRSYQRRGVPLTFIDGHEVTEIRPVDANKGKAVCALLSSRAPTPLALYIGDDRTDEDAFRQLPPSAITVRVAGPAEETAARYRLADPVEVQAFLNDVVAARSRR
jgi:trehalose-phosphatase